MSQLKHNFKFYLKLHINMPSLPLFLLHVAGLYKIDQHGSRDVNYIDEYPKQQTLPFPGKEKNGGREKILNKQKLATSSNNSMEIWHVVVTKIVRHIYLLPTFLPPKKNSNALDTCFGSTLLVKHTQSLWLIHITHKKEILRERHTKRF